MAELDPVPLMLPRTVRRSFLSSGQGDQIRRIFDQPVILFFGRVIEYYRISPNVWATIVQGKFGIIILAKNVLGFVLGDFFTNSSGRNGSYLNTAKTK
jgi:hypothetical protein